MTIHDLYAKYQIMPQLSLHMRRVASVGAQILDGWTGSIDRDLMIKTLLLHDMGNIVKFDLSNEGQKNQKSCAPGELEQWRAIQQDYWARYGYDAHDATIKILGEMSNTERVVEILIQEHEIYNHNPREILQSSPYAQILLYCDARVTPSGVVPLPMRIDDLVRRYGSRENRDQTWYSFLYGLEAQLQTRTTTKLVGINEESVSPILDDLLVYQI